MSHRGVAYTTHFKRKKKGLNKETPALTNSVKSVSRACFLCESVKTEGFYLT